MNTNAEATRMNFEAEATMNKEVKMSAVTEATRMNFEEELGEPRRSLYCNLFCKYYFLVVA